MIVVLVLLGVSLSLFLGFNFRSLEGMRLRTTGKDLYQFFKGARSAAMIQDTPNACLYYPANATIQEGLRNRHMFLPSGVAIILEDPPNDDEEPIALTTFYPDGTAVTNTILLGVGERRLAISIHPILGRIIVNSHPDEEL